MNWQEFVSVNGTLLVNWFSNNVDDSAQSLGTDWHHDGVAGVVYQLSSDETLGGVKSDCSYVVATQMLSDFQNQSVLDPLYLESVENWGQIAFELHIDYGANDLGNLSHGSSSSTETSYKR